MNLAWSVRLIPRDQFDAAREAEPDVEISPQHGTPYGMRRELIMSPLGVPCTPPPWGTLSAVDLDAGEIRWQVKLGTIRDIMPIPMPVGRWGTPNIGGPVITAGGLVFIGAPSTTTCARSISRTATSCGKAACRRVRRPRR